MTAAVYPQFFVVGTPRSGTTLARAILTGHPEVEIPGETGFLPRLLRLKGMWWTGRRVRLSIFVRLAVANGRLARSGVSRADIARVVAAANPATPQEAVGAIYREFGRRADASIVGDKTPVYIDHLRYLGRQFPDAKVIQMVRHPLDTISSRLAQSWGPTSVPATALAWDRSQRAAADAYIGGRRLVIRLEDLIQNPETTAARMAEHLGLEPVPQMLEFAGRADVIAQQNVHPSSHASLDEPLGRTREWRQTLSEAQAAQAWALVRETAEAFGYEGPDGAGEPQLLRARLSLRWFRLRRSWRHLKTAVRALS